MKALITGGLGFLGYHLSLQLLRQGYRVDIFDNEQRGVLDTEVKALAADPRYRLFKGDIRGGELCSLGGDYDLIFHLAAIVGVENVVRQPYAVLRDNAECVMRLLDFGRQQKSLRRFIFPSSSEVYAGTLESVGMTIPTPETTPLMVSELERPRTSYMLSKIYGEALCLHSGLPITIIRPHNVYGPRMGMAHVIPQLLARAHHNQDGRSLQVYSPRHTRTFCYVDDAIQLILRLALSPRGRGTFNVGSLDGEIEIAALAKLVVTTVGKDLRVEAGPDTEGSPVRRRPDVSRAAAAASYAPSTTLANGLAWTYSWYRSHVFGAALPTDGSDPVTRAAGISLGHSRL